ncbi:hypothetical protein [Butyrivibrio sp. YAB3001]|uniref:hypothetical protein n=1 Tax=Butyrivibrio sp. YAB3001 TaxID=1520812 RepID=UPI0008F647F2|nr:hypothetical protein [Butyrivibrio sp. YAB3001]SFC22444.1 hypothetical protein SAMN02910398_01796 [Butyrivibrio sp. YAB3001]
MKKSALFSIATVGLMVASVFCVNNVKALSGAESADSIACGRDLKPVIYLYPTEDDTEISVSLDYDGNLVDIIPEFNAENTWNVVADTDGTITYEGQDYNYLFWEGDPNFSYDFYSGYCVKGADTEAFLTSTLPQLGLNDAEAAEFKEFWLPMMTGNEYNVISFQYDNYTRGAKLTVSPQPDSLIRVFMAWYPSDKYVKINPQYLDTPSRSGYTVVEWGGNKVK